MTLFIYYISDMYSKIFPDNKVRRPRLEANLSYLLIYVRLTDDMLEARNTL